MVSYETFNKNFFKGVLPLTWFNRRGVAQLDDTRVIEITLVTNGVHRQYDGYQVEILHKQNGLIASWYFDFDEYLKERVDTRKDWNGGFYIIEHICEDTGVGRWYIAVPSNKEIKSMAKKIANYIDFYRLNGSTMSVTTEE